MALRCPTCQAVYRDEVRFCAKDGATLELLQSSDPLVGQVLDGRFILLERLGEGGMGAVYKAQQVTADRVVAVKVLKPELCQDETYARRFLLEARTTSRLGSPHTVTVHDFGETPDGLLYLVMECLRGRTLRAKLEAEGPLPVLTALRLLQHVCASLGEAHALGVVHRDVKPENVFLVDTPTGEFAKVLDFGIVQARALQDTKLTRTGQFAGTPAYVAPEVAAAEEADPRSDVYALGIMLFELLSGQPPFHGATPLAVLAQHVHQKVPSFRDLEPPVAVPPEVEDLVRACLAKDPAGRPATASALATRIDELRGTPIETASVRVPREKASFSQALPTGIDDGLPARPAGRARLLSLAVAASALLTAGALYLATQGSSPSEAPRVTEPVPLALGAGGGGGDGDGSTEPPAPAPAPVEAVPVAAAPIVAATTPTEASILVPTQPPGATISYRGRELGRAPGPVVLPRGAMRVPLEVRLEGHHPETIEVLPDQDREVPLVALRKVAKSGDKGKTGPAAATDPMPDQPETPQAPPDAPKTKETVLLPEGPLGR